MSFRHCIFLISFFLCANAQAFNCKGSVSVLAIGPVNGTLQVNAGYGVHYLCRFHETMNGVHPEICKAWFSMFLSAKMSGKKIDQVYDGSVGGAKSCSELGSWKVPNPMPYFVNLVDN